MKKVVILGAGGFAREVVDVIDAINHEEQTFEVLGYVVDPQYGSPGTIVNDKPILGDFEWLAARAGELYTICGVGASHHRYQLVKRAEEMGCRFCSIIHPSAILTRWVKIGDGVVVTAGCILSNQIRIGNHVLVNLGCTIGHDAVLEDFVSLAPGVRVSGTVLLEEGAYVGTGASIIEKRAIGAWSLVGAGSVVIEDVPANTTVVGNPAKVIKEREAGWQLA